MRKIQLVGIAGCVAAALCFVPHDARAQTFEKSSTLTVTEPLQVPGKVLEPGTYVVKEVDTQSDRNVIQFMNADETKVVALAIATPHVGSTAPKGSEFVYFDNRNGQGQEVLRSWFPPDDRFGQDFVYPHDEALVLARLAKEPVKAHEATAVATKEELQKTPITTVAPPEEKPAPPPTQIAENQKELPRTASHFPLMALSGLLALGGAAALHVGRRFLS